MPIPTSVLFPAEGLMAFGNCVLVVVAHLDAAEAVLVMVIGEAPITVKAVQDVPPEHVAEVVATLPMVVLPEAWV